MIGLRRLILALAFGAIPLTASAQVPNPNETVDKMLAQEQLEMRQLRQYSPLVETYIQYLRPDKQHGETPDGDKYFLGRAQLMNGIEIAPINRDAGVKHKIFGGVGGLFTTEFLPRGFLQMIYLDTNGFDKAHYKFEYVGREFLGEVRCLVFDVSPLPRAGKGRFVGRLWVEDEGYHIVRFNGVYGGASLTSNYLNFDSWRVNVGKNLWLPAFVYSEGPSIHDPVAKNLGFRAFRAQTRLWGYDLGQSGKQQEITKLLVEIPNKPVDRSEPNADYSPLQASRAWDRTAETNVAERLERQGLMAPAGEVDRVLETVINNLEVTNNLDIQPEVRCRVLMTSTLEAFTMGHTIVLSRGLIDVLPDEASLAVVLAHELGHVVLHHRMDSQYAFFGHLRFDEKGTFRHFDFGRTEEEEQAADAQGIELLQKSPYTERLGTAQVFLQSLQDRSKEVPNLVSPHLGDSVVTSRAISASKLPPRDNPGQNVVRVSPLPLGGRVKVDPWNDRLTLLKAESVEALTEDERKPLQITPIAFYLTRQIETNTNGAAAASLDPETQP